MGQVLWFYCETWLMAFGGFLVIMGLAYLIDWVGMSILNKRDRKGE